MELFIQDIQHPQVLLLFVFAYLLGSIPFGLILSNYFKKVDPRNIGSGNIGATNVIRAAGFKVGLLTFILDFSKGAIPVWLALSLGFSYESQAVVGLLAVIGHCFPVWLSFSGGKGVATGFGVILVLSLLLAGITYLGFLIAFSISYRFTKQVSFASLTAVLVLMGADHFVIQNGFVAGIIVIIALIIVFQHKSNLRKLF
ncbi:MAG: glycerol-3-phosphate 1-O-acyltransferase PlsY [bacterium]|nr:glycerol-3-phosphate 1-O-acyltransferase PlsY [bacterium]